MVTLCLAIGLLSSPLFINCAIAAIYYVDADATGNNDGLSWGNAFLTLQDALVIAVPGDQIWAAAGTYYPDEGAGQTDGARSSSFDIPSDVEVYGGFGGTNGAGGGILETGLDQRDWRNNITILSGDLNQDDTGGGDNSENAYQVVTFDGVSPQTVLDGFTITAGNADSGYAVGGGIYNDSLGSGAVSSPTISNCTISNNHADWSGGGVFNGTNSGSTSNPTLTNCVISRNSSSFGGGICNNTNDQCTCSPILLNCVISGNEANSGGGICNNAPYGTCRPKLTNCIISGNQAFQLGGGMWNSNYGFSYVVCEPILTNCTISGNRTVDDDWGYGPPNNGGGGIYSESSAVQLINCILWNNASPTFGSEILLNGTPLPSFTNCIVKGSGGSAAWDTSLGTDNGGNIDVDPLFVVPPDPAAAPTTAGDVHLQAGSPGIDQGTATGAPATDIDGHTRDASPDMGADEFVPDTDGDGEPDITDGCPNDPLKITSGACGCGTPDTDTDGDGTPNCSDGCPNDRLKTSPGACGCGTPDTDTDGNGTPDCVSAAPQGPVANAGPDQAVDSETLVYLYGYHSYDPDGTIVSYLWEQTDGPVVTLTDVNSMVAQFTSPSVVTGEVPLTFTLTVIDDDGLSSSASVHVTISSPYEDSCEEPPQPISPASGVKDLSLTPVLVIDKGLDPITCGTVDKTRWQISEDSDFQNLLYDRNVFEGDLFSHRVPPGVLKPYWTYYWRANIHCGSGCLSEYSTPSFFVTGGVENDANWDGMPDDQEPTGKRDLNGDGQPDTQGNHFRSVRTVVGNKNVAIETSGNITFLQSLGNNSQEIIDGMPANMPWGLINFRIETANPGDTVQVIIYLDKKAPADSVFYKYDPIDGWIDYSDHATFAPDMKSVTIEIQDGGFGDLDGVANGVVVDPAGIGTEKVGGGGSGGGCFLNVAFE
ncbi:MAG: choice-of-anchor U domain-containing protein [Thermodesulfobacteriota bacterium]